MPCYLNCVIWIKFHIYSWIPREFLNHISLNSASATRANIKQIPNICAPSRVCFWGLRLQLPWLASLSLLHSSFAKYAHLICSTCTDRLCQRIWAQLACTSAYPFMPPWWRLWTVTCHAACTTCTRNQTCPQSATHVATCAGAGEWWKRREGVENGEGVELLTGLVRLKI